MPIIPSHKEQLIQALINLIADHCTISSTTGAYLDSLGSTANAEAIRLLEQFGKVKIRHEYGGKIVADWI